MVDILVPISLFITIFGIVYVAVSARNKEKLALIEKGLDASILHSKTSTYGRYGALKVGLLAIGVSLGLLFGNVLEVTTELSEETAYFAMVFLFGGISLIVYYRIMKKIKPE